MEEYSRASVSRTEIAHTPEATAFLVTVYMWMWVGLSITSVVAWSVSASPAAIAAIFGNNVLFIGLLIGELALVMVLSAAINKLSAGLATFLFLAYSAVNGLTLSFVFIAYTGESVFVAFFSAACLFATLSLYGYITKRDLTSLGSYLMVGLIALIICLVVNMFLRSSGFDYILSLIGVVLFLGLTAYDTQKVLRFGATADSNDRSTVRKVAIMGALALYLDFINLFLYMLRFLGKRR